MQKIHDVKIKRKNDHAAAQFFCSTEKRAKTMKYFQRKPKIQAVKNTK